MRSFNEFAEFVLKNSKHNTQKDTRRVHIILDYPELEWGDYYQYLMTLTWFTGIGASNEGSKSCNLIFAKNLDEAVAQADEYDHALVSYVGTFYNAPHMNAIKTIHNYFEEFCSSGLPCQGHILWHPNKQYGKLHLQSMFLNLKHWRTIGRPTFGVYTGRVMLPEISRLNVHDDYTPLWLKPSNKFVNVEKAEMAEYISRVLEDNKNILNFDQQRNTKFFTYPKRNMKCEPLEFERNKNSNIIYARNNTIFRLYKEKLPKFKNKFDVIYAPAAGYIAEFLYQELGHKDTELVIYDNNKPSLLWKERIYQLAENSDDINKINKYFAKTYNSVIDQCEYKPKLNEENEKIFSTQQWLDTIKKIKNHEFIQHDIVRDELFNVDANKKNYIHLSNIFSYMFLIHNMKIEDIHAQFQKYCQLPSSVIQGKNVFKDNILVDNTH